MVCAGMAMFAWDETGFAWQGVLAMGLAIVIAGVRWPLTERLLASDSTLTRVQLLRHAIPACLVLLLPMSVVFEARHFFQYAWGHEHLAAHLCIVSLIAVAAGLLTLLLTFIELAIIQHSSALSLSILATCAKLLIVLLLLVFGRSVNMLNGAGILLTLSGIALYCRIFASIKADKPLDDMDIRATMEAAFAKTPRHRGPSYTKVQGSDGNDFEGDLGDWGDGPDTDDEWDDLAM